MYVILHRDPTGGCDLCGTPFYGQRDMVAHLQTTEHRLNVAAAIADRHEVKRALAPFHDPEWGDPEIEAHMRRVGQRMLREGRWEVKPSERAGF